MNRIAECLGRVGFEKPTKGDIGETIQLLLNRNVSDHSVEILIGQLLRQGQKWPKKVTETDDFAWLRQARSNTKGSGFRSVIGGGRWMYASDGQRVHRIIAVTNIEHTPKSLSCASLFKDLIQGPAITLDTFTNVTEDIVEFSGHTYLESYILEAFSGSPVMTAAPTSNGLYLATSGREAIIQEMRI